MVVAHIFLHILTSLFPAEEAFTASLDRAAAVAADGSGVAQGMNWTPPGDVAAGLADLRAMREAGVTAVRTDLFRNESLLTLADTLGIDLYVELPVSTLPARRLLERLSPATVLVDTAAALARRHPSVRNIGLARNADTSDSRTCAYFERLTERVREVAPSDVRVYYVTRFIESDQCAHTVDFVLVDVRDAETPLASLHRWQAIGGDRAPLGLAALGTWIRGDTLRGLNVPASLERQARYFETHLSTLLSEGPPTGLPVVFVHRWRDVVVPYPETRGDLVLPYVQRYGLFTLDDHPRPAFDVVSGIYAGRQSVFVFDLGERPRPRAAWPTVLGWMVIAMLAVFYALSPRFRNMVPRYFRAHFFFRDSVREGRDVLFGANTILLISLGITFGLVTGVVLDDVRRTDFFAMAVRWMPDAVQNLIVILLSEPLVQVVLLGCVYVFALLTWTLVLSLVSRRKYRVAPAQALMLVVWPRWLLLIVMAGAMVLAASASESAIGSSGPVGGGIVLLAAWIVGTAAAMVRTLYDFTLVTRVPLYVTVLALLLNPGVLLAVAGVIALIPYEPEIGFLWNVVTRR